MQLLKFLSTSNNRVRHHNTARKRVPHINNAFDKKWPSRTEEACDLSNFLELPLVLFVRRCCYDKKYQWRSDRIFQRYEANCGELLHLAISRTGHLNANNFPNLVSSSPFPQPQIHMWQNFREYLIYSFYVKLLTDRQKTDVKTNRQNVG